MSAVLITLPCTARQLEAALHSYCDHHGAWDMRIMSDAISSGRSIQDTRITLALSEGSGETSPSPSCPTSSALANSAAMREACANIAEYAKTAACHTKDAHLLGYLEQIERWAKSALSASPRNCDVGTPDEQEKRFSNFCVNNADPMDIDGWTCDWRCPLYKNHPKCKEAWAQMPYEKGETDGGK